MSVCAIIASLAGLGLGGLGQRAVAQQMLDVLAEFSRINPAILGVDTRPL
jgi:hypothetical protein